MNIPEFAEVFQGEFGCDDCPVQDICKSPVTNGMYCAEVFELVLNKGVEALEVAG